MYQTFVHAIAVLIATFSMATGMTKAADVVPAISDVAMVIDSVSDTDPAPVKDTLIADDDELIANMDTTPAVDSQPGDDAQPSDDDGLVDIEENEIPLAPVPKDAETMPEDTEDTREWPPLPCCTTVEFVDDMVVLTNTHGGYLCRAIVTEEDFYAGNWVFEDVIGPAISEEEANGTEIKEPTAPEMPDEGTDVQEYEVPLAPAPVREMPPLPCCTEVEFRDGMVYLTNTHGGYYSYAVATEDDFYAGNWSWE